MKVLSKIFIIALILCCDIDSNVDTDADSNSKPRITILGDSEITLYEGDVYNEPGFTGYDNEDGDITKNIIVTNNVDFNTSGTYFITYSLVDSDSLAAEVVKRTIVIKELKLRNILIFIGDGMGINHIEIAGIYKNGIGGQFVFENFPITGEITNSPADTIITDSAAAATAIATGVKVNNGVISKRIPGDSTNLPTILEFYKSKEFYTGLITTTFITHATPAAFGAHQDNRNIYNEIAIDLFTSSQPNILFGGGGNGVTESLITDNGYSYITNKADFNLITPNNPFKIAALFGASSLPYILDDRTTYPLLNSLTEKAIYLLEDNANGFFLMVEGGRIDHASHSNNLPNMIGELIEFEKSIDIAYEWAKFRRDTLIIVTSDHETGGLNLISNNGVGVYPNVSWTSTGHTAANIKFFVWGLGAEEFSSISDNTNFYSILTKLYEKY